MADVRLIDANALEKDMRAYADRKYANGHIETGCGILSAICRIEVAPTIDAVEVVRCRDCKHAIVNHNHIDKPLICCLTKMVGTTEEDWFCADGKRRIERVRKDEHF